MKACITYSVITDESASDGDYAEHGWWFDHGEYALEDSNGRNEVVLAEAQAGEFDIPWRDALRSAIDLGATEEIQVCGSNVSARSVDPPCDRAFIENGESRSYTVHFECGTPWRARVVAAALKAGQS